MLAVARRRRYLHQLLIKAAPAASAMSSSNPALAAIQRAKREAELQKSESRKGSLDIQRSMGSGAHTLTTAKSIKSPSGDAATNPLGNPAEKNIFGAADGTHEKGWWAHVDAGTMNAEDSEQKKAGGAAAATVSRDTALAPKKGLDFGSMFADRAQEPAAENSAPAPVTPTSPAGDKPAEVTSPTAAAAQAGTVTASVTSPSASGGGAVPGVQLSGGPFKDADGKDAGWWTQMDAGNLNKVEEHVKEGGAFKPQFVGSSGLTAKLDFASMGGAEQ